MQLINSPGVDTEQINSDGDRPIHLACKKANKDVFDELLMHQVDMHTLGSQKNTTLHCAVESRDRHSYFVKIILKCGIDRRKFNQNYKTAIDLVPQSSKISSI
jgi:ankyrin repeat protein